MLSRSFYSWGLFLTAALSLVIPSGYSYGFYALCIVGIITWPFVRTPLITEDSRYFFLPLMIYAFGNLVMAMNEQLAGRQVEPYIPFLFLFFGVWGIRRYKPRANWFWIGIAVGAIGASLISGYQALALGMRANGHTNPIQFGNIALLFGMLCMVQAIVVPARGGMNIVMWFGFASGLAASVWSQTRGGWLAIIFIIVWILKNATSHWPRHKKVGVFTLVFLCIAIPASLPNGVVQSRMKEGVVQLKSFIETGEQNNSVGIRVALWAVGLDGLKRAPIFGQGNDGWVEVRDAAIADGKLSSIAKEFAHLHNEFIDILVKRGLVGLVLYLAMLLIPMIFFFRPFISSARPDIRALAMAGMVIPMMYMDFGLTQTFLSHNSGRIVLCSLWMCAAGLMLNALEDNQVYE